MTNEIWKDIKDYEGLYKVSNFGRVKSLKNGKEKVLKGVANNYGYLRVTLRKNGKSKNFLIHRLVAQAFIPNTEQKPYIDHINTIRDDNRVENLRWCTQKENLNNPLSRQNIKDKDDSQVKKVYCNGVIFDSQVKKVYCNGVIFDCIKSCAEFYGVNYSTMKDWLNGRIKTIPQKFKELGLRPATEEDLQKYPMYDKNVHGEKANIDICIQKPKAVYCDGMIFETITKCAEFYGITRMVMSRWLNNKRPTPQKFKDLGLRYATEDDLKEIA